MIVPHFLTYQEGYFLTEKQNHEALKLYLNSKKIYNKKQSVGK